MEDKRESLIFYRSFFEAIKELPSDQQWEVYNAMFEYALNFKEIDLTWIPKVVFTLIKPQLEANRKKYLNGKKAKRKQNGSKTEAKQQQAESKTEGNVNDNVNKNVKYIKEYEDFILKNKNITSVILKTFFALWYKPNEKLDDFRTWVQERIIDNHNIESIESFEFIINNFYDYWIEQKNIKNKIWKTTLTNSFHLKDIRK